jgi:hypothetical protein
MLQKQQNVGRREVNLYIYRELGFDIRNVEVFG